MDKERRVEGLVFFKKGQTRCDWIKRASIGEARDVESVVSVQSVVMVMAMRQRRERERRGGM